jgi:prepilin-type N-terminal cleavage/methylation domain-containing protein
VRDRGPGTLARPAGRGDDRGATLIELLVGMVVMSLGMTIFTTATLQIYRSLQWTERATAARDQLSLAFGRLDREVRYASEISMPGSAIADGIDYWFVEYATVRNSAEDWCSQLRVPKPQAGVGLANSNLQLRTWQLGATPDGFTPIASYVQPPAANPFSQPSGRQLRIVVTANGDAEATNGVGVAQTDILFTALNSTGTTTKVTQCAQQRG